jgi:response regulator RpfG family c-di-GMP phosphodiesterase
LEFSPFGNSNTVLLVDDESDIVETNEQLLKRQGFNVFGFTNPQKALQDFQINSRQYGLVISDIRMPEMKGYEFTKKVKEIKPEVNVFVMTAFDIDDQELNEVLPSIKIDELIQKPISSKDLVSVINKYIKNITKVKPNAEPVDNLDLPDGLKEQLASHNLPIEQLMAMKISDLADKFGIDQDAARLIINALRHS